MSGYNMDFGEWIKKMPRKTTLGDYTRTKGDDDRDGDGAKRDLETRLRDALRRERKALEERLLSGPAPTHPHALRAEDV